MPKSLEAVLRIFLPLVRADLGDLGGSSWWIWISVLPSFAVRLVPLESALAGVTADRDVLLLLGVMGVELSGHFGGGGKETGVSKGGSRGGGVLSVNVGESA